MTGNPLIPDRVPKQVTAAGIAYKKRKTLKGFVIALLGIALMALMAKAFPQTRFDWVAEDYHDFQGNFMGTEIKGDKEFVVVYNRALGEIQAFEIGEGLNLSIPNIGALVEVHYSSEDYPKILQNTDIRAVHIPNPDLGYDHLPTRYAFD